MSEWIDCLIGFGANLGNPQEAFQATQRALAQSQGVRQLLSSSPRITPAVGGGDQPNYLNAVFRLQTNMTPEDLHAFLVQLEQEAGRSRTGRWQPRTLDLDLLLYGTERILTHHLNVPHPRMTVRRFVLEPAVEIAGEWMHPIAQQPLAQLLRRLNDWPQRLLWVTPHQEIAQAVLEAIREQANWRTENQIRGVSEWIIELASDWARFEALAHSAKIVAWSNPRPAGLEGAGFAGPQIEMPAHPVAGAEPSDSASESIVSLWQTELMAAMQAADRSPPIE